MNSDLPYISTPQEIDAIKEAIRMHSGWKKEDLN